MLDSLRTRLIVIAVVLVGCVVALMPREITTRITGPDGVMRDTVVREVPIKRGLDLQGGMHLELELDQSRQVSSDPKRDIQLALQVLRKRMDEFGVTEPLVQMHGDDQIVVELAGITDPQRAKDIVQQSAFLEFRITDETSALEKSLPAMDRALRTLGVTGGAGAEPSAGRSAVADLLGAASDTAADSASADTASAADSLLGGSAILSSLIMSSGRVPGEYLVPETAVARVDSLINLAAVQRVLPRGLVLRWGANAESVGAQMVRPLYVLSDRPIVTGDRLESATAQLDPITNGPVVGFVLDREGGRIFGSETARHVGDYMAIILDGDVQGMPPRIQERIGRNGQISLYGKSMADAQDLALTLSAGALPVPLQIVKERQVGASLGADAISAGMIAGVIGIAFVVAVMVLYYKVSGMLAIVALLVYVLITLGALAGLGATLTLPGLAGLVLSISIAVDGNVLIFERIREELALGKTVRLSTDEGFRHAMSAIVDSNVTTALTALFLFQFGTGPVKGFAVTLIIGIAASLFTAVFVTRTLFMIWLDRRPAMSTLSI